VLRQAWAPYKLAWVPYELACTSTTCWRAVSLHEPALQCAADKDRITRTGPCAVVTCKVRRTLLAKLQQLIEVALASLPAVAPVRVLGLRLWLLQTADYNGQDAHWY